MGMVLSVEWESKTWMSSDQETEARAAGKSFSSLRVRMRMEIIFAYVNWENFVWVIFVFLLGVLGILVRRSGFFVDRVW
jgi:hypothetical protein